MIAVTAQGFVIGLGLVSPFGMQNAWILNQGIRKNHHLMAAGVCAVCDVVLISIGVNAHRLFSSFGADFAQMLSLSAIIFLASYSFYLTCGIFRTILWPESVPAISDEGCTDRSFWIVLGCTLLVTLMNPHVYAERIVILGAISTDVALDSRTAFASGAIIASFVWFFCLSSAAAKLGVVLKRSCMRLALDIVVALMLIGFTLYLWQTM